MQAQSSRTAEYTTTDDPLPRPAEEEFGSVAWQTVKQFPHLFRVSTPINIERLRSFLDDHPNPLFVSSVLTALKEGFWPWANTRPSEEYPET
ncbi:hypothetical protein GYMLUDRAFT_166759, partial [Collybiopsis luxurians FD-317 M1]